MERLTGPPQNNNSTNIKETVNSTLPWKTRSKMPINIKSPKVDQRSSTVQQHNATTLTTKTSNKTSESNGLPESKTKSIPHANLKGIKATKSTATKELPSHHESTEIASKLKSHESNNNGGSSSKQQANSTNSTKLLSADIVVHDKIESNNNAVVSSTKCKPVTKIVFIKTHKTGSTTTTSIFQRFGYKRNLIFALPKSAHIFSDKKLFSKSFVIPIPKSLATAHPYYDMLVNHAVYYRPELKKVVPNAKYFTILRRPRYSTRIGVWIF